MQIGRTWAAFVVALAAVGAGGIGAPAQDFAGYTEDQARAGQLVYESVCASCHMANLQGDFEAPELAGPNLLNSWGGREVNELFDWYCQVDEIPADRPPRCCDVRSSLTRHVADQIRGSTRNLTVPSEWSGV